MAEALYDLMTVCVPHRAGQATIGDDAFAAYGLSDGCDCPVPPAVASRLLDDCGRDSAPEAGPVLTLAASIAASGARVALLDAGPTPGVVDLGALQADGLTVAQIAALRCGAALRLTVTTPGRARSTAIHYGHGAGAAVRHSSLLVRSARMLCLEDRLWDRPGGSDYAARLCAAARLAGRKTVLVCKDAACVFRNSLEIRQLAETQIDYVVGDAGVLLLLHGIQRFDSLVPRLRAMGANAILWRNGHEPLIVERDGAPWTGPAITATEFWDRFLPGCLGRIAQTGSSWESARSDAAAGASHMRRAVRPPSL